MAKSVRRNQPSESGEAIEQPFALLRRDLSVERTQHQTVQCGPTLKWGGRARGMSACVCRGVEAFVGCLLLLLLLMLPLLLLLFLLVNVIAMLLLLLTVFLCELALSAGAVQRVAQTWRMMNRTD